MLDAKMPVVGGLEAAPMILERRPGQKILLCSALVDEEMCDRAERVGIAACLSKDDLEAIPRVAFELAFAERQLRLGGEARVSAASRALGALTAHIAVKAPGTADAGGSSPPHPAAVRPAARPSTAAPAARA